MPNRLAFAGAALAAIAALLTPQRAPAEGNLVVYCAVQEEWCRNMVAAFERQTGIKVAMTRKSSGEFHGRGPQSAR
jgi:iron(III) transport system substrate-binding protein